MLIKKLIVRKTIPVYEIIRSIKFNLKGLSLIVDNTTNKSEDSGNNVGKTTCIKIIDLCLGANSVRSLYFDDDTKSENKDIKEFLRKNKVEAELILLDEKNNETISIVRQLYSRGKHKINGKEYIKDNFWHELKILLFNLEEEYPTLRQLIPKFIRIDGSTSDNMIKYLQGTPSNDIYDTIYLFLFRILNNNLLSEKGTLDIKFRECEKKIKLYEKDDNILSLDSLKQKNKLIESELEDLNNKRNNLDYMDKYKEELESNRQLLAIINDLEEKAQIVQFDINLISSSIKQLKREKSNIDIKQINLIYKEAKSYIENISKTFEEVVCFHNTMIENRISFINNQLDIKKDKLKEIIEKRNILLEEKKKLTINILDEGLLDELNVLNSKIEDLNMKKGEINQSIKILEGVQEDKKELSNKIKIIHDELDPKNINEKISVFNESFSNYCEKLYGEKYLFVYNSTWKKDHKFPVSIDSLKGKMGTGMKKGIIVAFDLAYIDYVNKMKIKSPKFVIHDKLENTHINQLKTIFDLCKNINGQYIIPILRERVDKIDSTLIEQHKILELSSNDKFFKL